MTRWRWVWAAGVLATGLLASAGRAGEPAAAERGKRALLERSFLPATISSPAYQNLWRQWGERAKPEAYAEAVMRRYGLHPAPFPNNGYPMGLRQAAGLLGKGLATDCMFCHGGSIMGQGYVGLGNTTMDIQAFTEEVAAASGQPLKTPFRFSNVRGTVEAGGMSVYLLGLREPDLTLRSKRLDLELHDDLCEDTPAWWLLKKKKTMYYTGGGDARSVRSLMQFMMSPLNLAATFEREEAAFRDIQAFLLSIQPPKYPFAIDRELAGRGEQVFLENCARCHGTYGEKWTYPNKLVPLDVIGTDRKRYEGITAKFAAYYNQSWFAHEREGWLADDYTGKVSAGYQAPPLDGVWATAPYLHNGSVPTVYHLLNSKTRPALFTRSYRTDEEAYDPTKVGWKVQVLKDGPDASLPAIERRKMYDTTKPGRGNGGHKFGDDLSEEERRAVIEYLKTL